jgi:hypothetical protein
LLRAIAIGRRRETLKDTTLAQDLYDLDRRLDRIIIAVPTGPAGHRLRKHIPANRGHLFVFVTRQSDLKGVLKSGYGWIADRMEIVTGVERRRHWRADEKLRIVAECDRAGACLAAVARQHDVRSGLSSNWRRRVRRGLLRVKEHGRCLITYSDVVNVEHTT